MPNTLIPQNALKQKLASGQTAIGTMVVEFRQPAVMQVLANAGMDFVIIDGEHGPFGIESVADLSRAARQAGLTPIVRIPDLQYAFIAPALDAGAQGIMLPRVTDPAQVHECLRIMKYPPVGNRGAVLARAHTHFKGGSLADALQEGNAESMLVVQIETKQAFDRVEEILGIPGVDIGFIGPTDLSLSLGLPGRITDPTVVAAMEKIGAACEKVGIHPAIQMNDLQAAVTWAGKRMRIVSFSSEISILAKSASDAVAAIRGGFAK